MNTNGLLLCARYSAAPNFFGYCGPDENESLTQHIVENIEDREVSHILSHFETLYPYLQLIARENKIIDPFDLRVVEAYWIGNNLLQKSYRQDFFSFLDEKLQIPKKISKNQIIKIKTNLSSHEFYPHHSFHVMNIFKHLQIRLKSTTIETIDQCRIGWGKIIQNSKIKNKKNHSIMNHNFIFVETRFLELKNNKIQFGNKIVKQIRINYQDRLIINDLKIGDWVSFHWDFICDILSKTQVKNLEFYTQKSIEFYNS